MTGEILRSGLACVKTAAWVGIPSTCIISSRPTYKVDAYSVEAVQILVASNLEDRSGTLPRDAGRLANLVEACYVTYMTEYARK